MICKNAQPLLSEYIDNGLSARQTWELDRHFAECHACTRALNELRRTVQLVNGAPRREVSGDFMAKLQARLEDVEPAQPRWAWLQAIRDFARPNMLPAWGAAVATVALLIVFVYPRTPVQPSGTGTLVVPASVQQAVRQNVAISASDPLADVATANLEAHATMEGDQAD